MAPSACFDLPFLRMPTLAQCVRVSVWVEVVLGKGTPARPRPGTASPKDLCSKIATKEMSVIFNAAGL